MKDDPRPLRVLHVTLSDRGGAGIACIRLHRAMRAVGVDSHVLVRDRALAEVGVEQLQCPRLARLATRFDRLRLKRYPRRRVFAWWSVNAIPWSGIRAARGAGFDIVHLHWVGDALLPVRHPAGFGSPLVWTLHDMWPFTGGCHYTQNCERFESGCGECPQLGSDGEYDLSYRSAGAKRELWSSLRPVAVCPSHWMAGCARRSKALAGGRVEVIPYAIDTELFSPGGDRASARSALGLPSSKSIILTGAAGVTSDIRKGFSLLVAALKQLPASVARDLHLAVFGAREGPTDFGEVSVSYLGSVQDERLLPEIYRSADVFVLPSLQDNLPNTVIEAFACGVPVVAFRTSGLAEMIDHGRTGRLAEPFSIESLRTALITAVIDARSDSMRAACRQDAVATYGAPGPVEAHRRLYASLLPQVRAS